MPSELERCMESLITIFHKYAGKEGCANSLNKKELKELMTNELSNFLKVGTGCCKPVTCGSVQNGDQEVAQEFVALVVGLSISCEQLFQIHLQKQGKNPTLKMPSELERCMESLITIFHKYAGKEGRANSLNKRELKELMTNELSSFLKSQKNPAAVDKIMKDLDQNGDQEVDFEEFVALVVGLSISCEQLFQIHLQKQGKK
ncbi:troponin C [Huso huso]|uniref:Troponin C n=1 Tax=Huso huso TaxID=61971 RepID=A0ABR0Y3C3_HUSHU